MGAALNERGRGWRRSMKRAFGSAVMMRDVRKARGRKRKSPLASIPHETSSLPEMHISKGDGTSTDIATVMSRESYTIFYRADDLLLDLRGVPAGMTAPE